MTKTERARLRKASKTWQVHECHDMAIAIITFYCIAPDGALRDEADIYFARYTELMGEAAARALALRIVGGLAPYDAMNCAH